MALLLAAALGACDDSASPRLHVRSVALSGLSTYHLRELPNDSLSFAATVSADPGYGDSREVSWTSSEPSVFRIDAVSGAGKALTAGTAVITARSQVDDVTGQISLSVFPAANPAATTVITGLFQGGNTCGFPIGAAVDLAAVCGQINVAIDVSYATDSRPSTVSLSIEPTGSPAATMPCYTVSFGGPALRANSDISTVILSCNTAAFDTTTGIPVFKSGSYTLRTSLTSASGTTPGGASAAITLNNPDFLRVTVTGTTLDGGRTSSSFSTGVVVWRAGTVNTKVLPVIFTPGRTITTGTVSLVNGGFDPASKGGIDDIPCGGVFATQGGGTLGAVNFIGTSTGASGVQRALVDTVIVVATAVDQAGATLASVRNADLSLQTPTNCSNAVPSTSVTSGNFIRLDNRPPAPSTWDPTAAGQGAGIAGNSAWLGSAISFPNTSTATNGLVVGSDNAGAGAGAGNVTTAWQYAPAGTAKTSTAWVGVSAPSAIPESNTSSAYNLRLITRDALGNADTTLVGIGGPDGTFGVDLRTPTVTVRSEAIPISGAIASSAACANNRIPGADATHPGSCAAVAVPNGGVFAVTAAEVAGTNGTVGSGLGPAPLSLSIRGIRTSGNGQAAFCGVAQTPAPQTDPNCQSVVDRVSTSQALPTAAGEYRVVWSVSDQANNKTTPTVFHYYVDNTPPLINGATTAPNLVAAGSLFTTDGLTDDLDVVTLNGALNYPGAGVRLLYPGVITGSAAIFDSTLARAKSGTITLSRFFRSLTAMSAGPSFGAGGKPDELRIRAVDGGRSLSAAALSPIAAASVTGTGAVGYTLGIGLNDFQLLLSPTTVTNSGTGGTRATTMTAHVVTPLSAGTSPFSEVCFYYANHSTFGNEGAGTNGVNSGAAGELVLIGCTSTSTQTTGAFDYTMTFDPPDAFNGPLPGGLTIRAIGVNVSGDALITLPVSLGVT